MKHFNMVPSRKWYVGACCSLLLLFSAPGISFSYNVTNITATYHNGQTFLTWNNAGATNLQYNVYRSTNKFTSSSQLTASKLLGFVRDNSSKNIHISQDQQADVFYRIEDNGVPLSANKGLYVITCTGNQPYYYAVTVTDLSNNTEAKNLIPGKNSMTAPVNEFVAKPQPVLQDSITVSDGEKKYRYVQFGNNQETPLYPAMNSTGSYGFNFYIVKRGSSTSYPLMVVYEGSASKTTDGPGLDGSVTNCYILGVEDWLPIPSGDGDIGVGDNTYFCCYHENFNIYSTDNPKPTSGSVKTYPQKRYIEAIRWAKNHFPIDATRVYTKGVSATGFGALLTAELYPNEIAAYNGTVEPMFVKPVGSKGDLYEQMWGLSSTNLNSDVPDPVSGVLLSAYTILDGRKLLQIDEDVALPLIFDVHGKKDKTVAWSPFIISWYDSLQANHVGGVFSWDQRDHTGNGKNFLPDETLPDFFRYQTSKSYPAFSNCSINQNPGNGSPNNGDPYGAINGYLDWDDNITDNTCDYSINVGVKDFYVGGVLDPEQFNTCKTDITFRRLQNFHPNMGATIKWKNYDASNTKIQNGSLVYNGQPITLKGIIVNKSGNKIQLTITNCGKTGDASADQEEEVYFTKSQNGYTAHVETNEDQKITVNVYDLMGRLVHTQKVSLVAGVNSFEITSTGSGIYLVNMKGNLLSYSRKLLF